MMIINMIDMNVGGRYNSSVSSGGGGSDDDDDDVLGVEKWLWHK